MSEPVIEAADVVKFLGHGAGTVQALKGVTLTLAGGELTVVMGPSQRVAIARAVVGRPSAVLADEPTAALDAENGHAIMTVLARIAREPDHGVLVVSHDPRILPFANRIVRIEDGRIVSDQPGDGKFE
jgi:ABC-type lipoprotein export system ATPase subunit